MESNILLISDRTPIFSGLAQLLVRAGYRVTLTFHGREAFQALRRGIFPLVITRYCKDWSDKRPFLDAVRELGQEISVLFLGPGPDETGLPREAFLMQTTGEQFTPCGWGGLRHLVTSCLSGRPAPVVREAFRQNDRPREGKVSYLEFRRKSHAAWQHSAS